jgi:putative transcriptional regulator
MTVKRCKSRILREVHEMASDLHRLGFIDQRKMRKYDALCLAAKGDRKSSPNASRPRVLARGVGHGRASAGNGDLGRRNRSAVSGVGFRLTSGQR